LQESSMIRRLKPADAKPLEEMLSRIPNFADKEISVAMELVNIAAVNTDQTDYNIFVYENENRLVGYHCTGRRPLTDGVFDLYWIAADPASPVKGVGKALLDHAEEFVISNNGRWILAETSSKDDYSNTRRFYLKNNYSVIAEINDFYAEGDNLLVFGKFFKNNTKKPEG
jgi:ribosomal protein S18 acetylase RimI-like enzyme